MIQNSDSQNTQHFRTLAATQAEDESAGRAHRHHGAASAAGVGSGGAGAGAAASEEHNHHDDHDDGVSILGSIAIMSSSQPQQQAPQ